MCGPQLHNLRQFYKKGMKNRFLLLGMILALWAPSMGAWAQINTYNNRPKLVTHFELGYNMFRGDTTGKFESTIKGLGSVKFNLTYQYRIYAGGFYFAPGLGLAISEWRFDQNLILGSQNQRLTYTVDADTNNRYGKSKFQLWYLRVPVEIGFTVKRFNIAVGGYADLLLFSKAKRKYEVPVTDGNFSNVRNVLYGNENFHTNLLQYGVSARVEYSGIGVYCNFGLSDLFDTAKGPKLQTWQIGLSFSSGFGRQRPKKTSPKPVPEESTMLPKKAY